MNGPLAPWMRTISFSHFPLISGELGKKTLYRPNEKWICCACIMTSGYPSRWIPNLPCGHKKSAITWKNNSRYCELTMPMIRQIALIQHQTNFLFILYLFGKCWWFSLSDSCLGKDNWSTLPGKTFGWVCSENG